MVKIISITSLFLLFLLISVLWSSLRYIGLSKEAKELEKIMREKSIKEGGKEILRAALKKNKDVVSLINKDYSIEQMEQVIMGIKEGSDVEKYADPSLPVEKMRELRYSTKKS